MGNIVHTSRIRIVREKGPTRRASIEGFDEPIYYGVHGGIKKFYKIEPEEEPMVVRRKKFALVPMNEAEAIEQMRLLGHDNFFIFFDADANRIKVLYRRRNGSYGLIEPEVG